MQKLFDASDLQGAPAASGLPRRSSASGANAGRRRRRRKYRLPDLFDGVRVETCFVCGQALTPENYTLEHLIPQWMIRRFGLEDAEITVCDRTRVRYLDYVLPACRECNCRLLGPVEATLARLHQRAADPSQEIPVQLVAKWASKVIVGTALYNNLVGGPPQLTFNVEIVPQVRHFDLCSRYLKLLRGTVVMRNERTDFPFSWFAFRTKVPEDPRRAFDLVVNPERQTFFVRMGHWSLLCRPDGGFIDIHTRHFFEPYLERELAPIQVRELAAHFFTIAERQRTPMYYARGGDGEVESISGIPIVPSHPLATPETDDDLVCWLVRMTRNRPEDIFHDGMILTWLKDANGEFPDFPGDLVD